MMESQQSTCYPESQKTPTKKLTKLIKKKGVLPAEHKKKGKGYMKHEQGNVYSLTFTAFSKTGLSVCPHQTRMTAEYHQCLHEVATNLHWQAALVKKSNNILQSALGRAELAEQNSTLWRHRVTKPDAPSSLPNSQTLSPANLPRWGIRALFALPRQDIPSSALRKAYGSPGYSDFSDSTHMLWHDLGQNNLTFIFKQQTCHTLSNELWPVLITNSINLRFLRGTSTSS